MHIKKLRTYFTLLGTLAVMSASPISYAATTKAPTSITMFPNTTSQTQQYTHSVSVSHVYRLTTQFLLYQNSDFSGSGLVESISLYGDIQNPDGEPSIQHPKGTPIAYKYLKLKLTTPGYRTLTKTIPLKVYNGMSTEDIRFTVGMFNVPIGSSDGNPSHGSFKIQIFAPTGKQLYITPTFKLIYYASPNDTSEAVGNIENEISYAEKMTSDLKASDSVAGAEINVIGSCVANIDRGLDDIALRYPTPSMQAQVNGLGSQLITLAGDIHEALYARLNGDVTSVGQLQDLSNQSKALSYLSDTNNFIHYLKAAMSGDDVVDTLLSPEGPPASKIKDMSVARSFKRVLSSAGLPDDISEKAGDDLSGVVNGLEDGSPTTVALGIARLNVDVDNYEIGLINSAMYQANNNIFEPNQNYDADLQENIQLAQFMNQVNAEASKVF